MRSTCITLLAAATLVAGCAQILGIEELSLPPDAAPVDSMVPPDAPECLASTDCAATTPICDLASGTCRSCQQLGGDDACAMRDEATPFCADDGTCAGCLDNTDCSEAAPVCDDSYTCSGCTEHSDCADYSGVCDRDSGACVPEDAVVYVEKEGGSDSAPCTKAQPCLIIDIALDQVRADNDAKYVVRILDGEVYVETLTLENITVQIIGDAATIEHPAGVDDTPVVDVGDNTDIAFENVTIKRASGNENADGVQCLSNGSANIRLRQVTVSGNDNIGIYTVQCSLAVERSLITGNGGGGIKVREAGFDITNSFIVSNGSSGSEIGGALIANSTSKSPQRFAFNTVAQNITDSATAAGGVRCSVADSTSLIATSNIIRKGLGGRPAAVGDCTWYYSNIEEGDTLGEIASMDNGNLYEDCGLTDNGGVLNIAAGSACQDAAEPGTGVDVDYEGDPRPQDTPDIGADEIASGS